MTSFLTSKALPLPEEEWASKGNWPLLANFSRSISSNRQRTPTKSNKGITFSHDLSGYLGSLKVAQTPQFSSFKSCMILLQTRLLQFCKKKRRDRRSATPPQVPPPPVKPSNPTPGQTLPNPNQDLLEGRWPLPGGGDWVEGPGRSTIFGLPRPSVVGSRPDPPPPSRLERNPTPTTAMPKAMNPLTQLRASRPQRPSRRCFPICC